MTRALIDSSAVASDQCINELAREDTVSSTTNQDGPLYRLRALWGSRRLIARITAAGLLVGMLIAFLIPKQYESSVQLMPPDNQSSSGLLMAALTSRAGGNMGGGSGDLLGLKNSGDLFVGILHSRTVQERLVQQFGLASIYGTKFGEDACRELSSNTSITADRKSGIISIIVTDRNPQRAQLISQAYVNELNRLVAELSTSAASRERVFLEERLKLVKQDLDQASRDFGQFASKNAAIDIKEQGRAMVEATAILEGDLIASQSEAKGLEEIYASNNSRVRTVRARIAELRKQLNDLGGKATDTTSGPAATANSLYPSIRQLPILGVTYADLYRRTKIQEVVYETLTQQYELAKVQEARETPSVKVLDPANIPQRTSFPPRFPIIFLCACFSFATAAVGVMTKAQWDRVDPSDPKKMFAHEVLHSLSERMPWSPPNGSYWHGASHRVWLKMVRPYRKSLRALD